MAVCAEHRMAAGLCATKVCICSRSQGIQGPAVSMQAGMVNESQLTKFNVQDVLVVAGQVGVVPSPRIGCATGWPPPAHYPRPSPVDLLSE